MLLNSRTERNGELAVRRMSEKAQRGYNETDPVTVYEDDGEFAIKTLDGVVKGIDRRNAEAILEDLVFEDFED